jgi:ATP synthase protein I
MGDNPIEEIPGRNSSFPDQVAAKVARKLKAHRNPQQGVWLGLGMSGLIGWSIAGPTFLGAMIGYWWDRRHPGAHSWTLALLAAGLVVGCAIAWHWMVLEDKAMHRDTGNEDE